MSKVNVKKYYSTKRKRDIVTGIAIILFGALIVFQLYVTIIFPFQLRHRQLLVAEMEKDEMYEQIDRIRKAVRSTRGRDSGQQGEISLVSGILDHFALHVRENGKEMTAEQVNGLRTELRRYELAILGWNYANRRFLYPEDTERGVMNSLGEFFGDIDAGGQIDPDKAVSFSEYFRSDHEKIFHVKQDTLDVTESAKKIENSILNPN